MRIVKKFNNGWLYSPEQVVEGDSDDAFEPVTLPHTNTLFTQRYVDNQAYQFVSTYRKHFTLEEDITGKQVFIDFDGVMLQAAVYCNGNLLGDHKGGYTPFSFELTDELIPGDNMLTVIVDSTEDKSVPPYGNLVDFLTFGGIYRDVYLSIVDACHIVDVFVRPQDVLTSPRLECDIQLSGIAEGMTLQASLQDGQGLVIAQKTATLAGVKHTLSIEDLQDINLWSLENPVLYDLHLTLRVHGKAVDDQTVCFGFRQAEFSADGNFYLNGQPLNLFGLNRHQTYPYIGAAAPERLQQMDADILKYELGCNIVRASHYAQSPHFIRRCDEIGLLVFEELAGWQHIGDAAWQALVLEDLEAMIRRDRNHPSIILWGVRLNESPDDDFFYTQTNQLAHDLDPTRQTGGVRNFAESNFLEDVFTLNDFTEGIMPTRPPHLITEFCGHMFPTKTWDHEERRLEHALRHARKHNLQIGHPEVTGAIGWCAFDYYTHMEFGSGDRICHHGVMDIFRLPKFAAYFYRSQKSPAEEVVLYAATNWTLGDRSSGGNNPLVIFSNCEMVEVIIGDKSSGMLQPASGEYPHLKHPPFVMRWPEPYNPWGLGGSDLCVRGYINDQVVAEHRIAADHCPEKLMIHANTSTLVADGADMARIAVRVVDRYGNVLPYQMPVVHFALEGDAQLIGENPMALLGGQGAVFLKSCFTPGDVTVHAQVPGLPPASVTVNISE